MRLWHEHQRESFRLSELSRRPTPRRPRADPTPSASGVYQSYPATQFRPRSRREASGCILAGLVSGLRACWVRPCSQRQPAFGDLMCFQGSLMVGHGMSSSRCVMSDEAARFINHNRGWPPFGHARCVLRCVFGPSVRRRRVGKSDASSEPAAAEESESPTETNRSGRDRLRRSRGV